jgi:hypothetical protein
MESKEVLLLEWIRKLNLNSVRREIRRMIKKSV